MASGGQNMTTYVAKHIIGDSQNVNWAGALLHSGTGGKTSSMDTWIFADDYGSASSTYGFLHRQSDDKFVFVGGSTDKFWNNLNTGDTYIAGKLGIGTTSPAYTLEVNGTSNFKNTMTITGASINMSKAGEVGIEVDNTQATNPNKVAFIVGSSGEGGLYSRKHDKWIVYADASGNVILNGNANTATHAENATKSGIDTIWMYPENNSEINFGGTNTGTIIYFGYRAKDSRSIPTKFVFGSSTGTADLQAKTIYLGSGTTSYISSTQYTGNADTATNISGKTPTLARSIENNEIKIIDLGNNTPANGAAQRHAIDFRWYDSHWAIGNLRSGSTPSAGFGFSYSDDSGTTYSNLVTISTSGKIIATGGFDGNLTGNAATATTATYSTYPKIVANNEIRFDVSTKPSNGVDLHIGYVWSDGSKDAKINGYIFENGNGSNRAKVYASEFVGPLNGTAAKATADADGNTITSTYAPLASPALTGTPTAPTAANGTNTTQIATTAFVNNTLSYINAMRFKGTLGTGGTITALPASHEAGDTYRVITAGTWAGKYCEAGTLIICIKDGTTASDNDWTSVETNEDGAVIGPSSSTGNNITTFSGNTGRIIQDSGKAFSTATPGSSSTDAQIPTAKAVWAAINALDANLNSTTPGAGKTLTAFSQTDGKVSATFGNISITESQISDLKSYLPLSGGTMTGDIKGNASTALGTTANPFHHIVLGGAINNTLTADSTNPRITFQESNNGAQPVHLIYSDYDSYRSPAGLKIIGGTGASPAWFEVEGDIWSSSFKITGKTTALTDNNLTFSQGGGWYMSDATWIRTVGSKSVYMNAGTFRNDGTTQLRTLQHVNANIALDGYWTTGATGTANSGEGNATQGTIGTSILSIGNATARPAAGTAGGANNAKGYLYIYGTGSGYVELTYNDSMFASNKSIYLTNTANSGINNEIRGLIATNDYWRVAGGATASNAGYMEIATADDSNEPIYVRQYSGVFTTLKRTATLLDASGNTEFPIQVTTPKFIGDSFASSKMIILPDNGYASADGTTVGAIKITLPVTWTATMMSMKVDIYNYNNDNCTTYTIGGYNYTGDGGYWTNCSSSSIGYGDKTNLKVRFGHDGTKCCIIIGEIDTSWSYPKVQVRNVLLGHSGVSLDTWMSGWTVSWITTLPENIDVIKSNPGIIPISHGGTNANDAATARSNLGTWSLVSDGYNTFMPADSTTNGWYKFNTTADNGTHGILPSNSGSAGNGHSYIGTSSWYWKYAYIDEIYGHLNGNAATATKSTNLDCPRVNKDVNEHPGKNIFRVQEFDPASANLPSQHWYYVYEGQGTDTAYSTQLALGETTSAIYYRVCQNNSWPGWSRIVTNSGSWGISVTGNAASASKISAALANNKKTYLLGTQTEIITTAANISLTGDTGVYLTTTAGELSAARHSWNVSGTEKAYTIYNTADDSIDFIFV